MNQKLTILIFDQYAISMHDDQLIKDPTEYQRLIERLFYLTTTKSDIAFAVQCLSQFMHSPKTTYMEAALRVVKYIKQSPSLGILMSSERGAQLSVL